MASFISSAPYYAATPAFGAIHGDGRARRLSPLSVSQHSLGCHLRIVRNGKSARRKWGGICSAEQKDSDGGEKKPDDDEKSEKQPGDPSGDFEWKARSDGPSTPSLFQTNLAGAEVISKEYVDVLRNQVFGFDTFFVTGQEPYEGGVLFTGNLRGDSAKAHAKLTQRVKEKFGDQLSLFLLKKSDDDRPVAIVIPSQLLKPLPAAIPEWVAAGAFGLTTIYTLLQHSAALRELDVDILPSVADFVGPLLESWPGALVIAAILAAHELGHRVAANKAGLQLSAPFFIPSWQIGSFGGITRVKGVVPSRGVLAEVAAAGPLWGSALAMLIVVGSLLLSTGEEGVVVDTALFHDSLLVGGLAKLFFGPRLVEDATLVVSPLLLPAWTALFINALNSIPVGELDGGRIAHAIWGRKAAARLTGLSLVLLAGGALLDDVALYWVVLIVLLQRGPIAPQADELSPPSQSQVAFGVGVLVLGLLVCCPEPFPFS